MTIPNYGSLVVIFVSVLPMQSVTVKSKNKVFLPYLLSYYKTEVWTFYYYLFILDFGAKYCPLNKFIPSSSSYINHFESLTIGFFFVHGLKIFSLKRMLKIEFPLCSLYLNFSISWVVEPASGWSCLYKSRRRHKTSDQQISLF